MEGATTLGVQSQDSPSKPSPISPGRKLPRKSAPKYSSCLLYNTAQAKDKLTGLTIATCNPSFEGEAVVTATEEPVLAPALDATAAEKKEFMVSGKMSCNFCQTEFTHRTEQKHHYRSDWHRFNLKQRIKGLNSVSEDAFETISGNISSLSGSDTDTDESDKESDCPPRSKPIGIPARLRHSLCSGSESESESGMYVENLSARKYPKVYLRNTHGELLSLYRCVLYHKKSAPETCADLTNVAFRLPDHMTWAIMMAGGGHFAAAIFDKDTIVQHKTFHRYVVRAKRGTAQGSRDSQGNAPKSGGASLRRHNEAALMQDIQELIASWEDLIKTCHLIFLRAPSFNRQIFFGGKNPPFRKTDPRIRVIPFPTRRATYKEVRRIHEMLASIECYGNEEDIREFVPMSPRRQFSLDSGHLEPITDSDKSLSPKKRPSKSKTQLSPLAKSQSEEDQHGSTVKQPSLPVVDSLLRDRRQSTSSIGSSASDVDLVELHQEISTLNLKLFEATRKPRRRKLKKKKSDVPFKHQNEPESNVLEEEKYHLKNSLYTACKVGDLESLRNLLAIFDNPTTDQSAATTSTEPQTVSDKNADSHSILSHDQPLDNSTNQKEGPSSGLSNDNTCINPANPGQDDIAEDVVNKNICSEGSNNQSAQGNKCIAENAELSKTDVSDQHSGSSVDLHLAVTKNSSVNNTTNTCRAAPIELLSPVVTKDLLNEPIGDSRMTLLHVVSKEGHKAAVGLLLGAGADPSVRDRFGQTSYTSGKSKEVRNEFRRFMAKFPDRYDYQKAEVPGPLTDEMEKERKQRDAERKKLQRKAKQERLKDQKAEEAKVRGEEQEKRRFLALSDREKRALAAERRQVQSAVTSGQSAPVLVRCFRCGCDMTGKVPFEYSDYKFCTPKCLKEHRFKSAAKNV